MASETTASSPLVANTQTYSIPVDSTPLEHRMLLAFGSWHRESAALMTSPFQSPPCGFKHSPPIAGPFLNSIGRTFSTSLRTSRPFLECRPLSLSSLTLLLFCTGTDANSPSPSGWTLSKKFPPQPSHKPSHGHGVGLDSDAMLCLPSPSIPH